MSTAAVVWAIHQKGMKASQWRVLVMLSERANKDTHECWPSYSTIAEDCEITRSTAIKAVAQLEKRGYLHIIKRIDEDGDSTSNLFKLRVGVKITQVLGGAENTPPPKDKSKNRRQVAVKHIGGGVINTPPSAENTPGVVQELHQGGVKITPKPCNLTISNEPSLSHSTEQDIPTGADEHAQVPGEREKPIFDEKQKPEPTQGHDTALRATEKPPEAETIAGGGSVCTEDSKSLESKYSDVGDPPTFGVAMPSNGQPFCPPHWVHPLWFVWEEQRRSLKSYSEPQKAVECRRLGHLVHEGWTQLEVLENSISLGKGRLYPPCAPGKERETLAARKAKSPAKTQRDQKSVGGGTGAKDATSENIRALQQELKGFTDQLRLVPESSRSYELLQQNIATVEQKIKSWGGACS